MEKFPRIIIDKKFEANESFIELLQDYYDRYGLTYDFNNEYFINKSKMNQEAIDYLIDECKKESINFKVYDSFEIDKTDAIGMYTLNVNMTSDLIDDKSLFIYKTDETEELHFILTFYPIAENLYEVNIIDVKKKLFFNDQIKLDKAESSKPYKPFDNKKQLLCNSTELNECESLTAKTLMHYKKNQKKIYEQGFEKSAALKLIEYCFKRNLLYCLP